jgi:RNA polymerase sigma factor (TIGR02999 family)
MSEDSIDVTLLLRRAASEDDQSESELIVLLYDRILQQAHRLLRGERATHWLEAGDLAHEAVLRILRGRELAKAKDRNQVLRAYARALRQALIDYVRGEIAEKRGGDRERAELDEFAVDVRRRRVGAAEDLDEALRHLAEKRPRAATVLEMKYFGGFTIPEIAAALELAPRTVERDCRTALAWLRTHFGQASAPARRHSERRTRLLRRRRRASIPALCASMQ